MRVFFMIFWLSAILPFFSEAQPQIESQRIDENLYVISGMGGNVAFLVTPEGVLVVDSGTLPIDGKRVTSLVSEVTNAPIRYLVYTHCHGDHVGGAIGLPDGIEIVGHSMTVNNLTNFIEPAIKKNVESVYPELLTRLEAELSAAKPADTASIARLHQQIERAQTNLEEYRRMRIRYPKVTFDDSFTIELGGQHIDLFYYGPGHTNDNIVVVFRNQNILHAGDLVFNGMVPYIFPTQGGTIKGWRSALIKLMPQGFAKVIPGHGPVGGAEILMTQIRFFERLMADVKKLKGEGKSLEDIQSELTPDNYGLKGNEQQFPENVKTAFDEL